MDVRGLVWLGTRTEHVDEMADFAERVLGLTPDEREDGMATFSLPDGSAFEVFSMEHPGGGFPAGVVAGFEVDDVAAAVVELAAAGVEVSAVHQGQSWRWAYVTAPDGHVYELCEPPR
jgi:catechol 2,3-dioxygenase-like lactoylglutathione lyase family enzyme